MKSHLIIITGDYVRVRNILKPLATRGDLVFFQSLENGLTSGLSTEHLIHTLMEKEFERDTSKLLPLLNSGKNAVVEQWHIGNLARARTILPSVAKTYEERLVKYIGNLQIDLNVFYVSFSDDFLLEPEIAIGSETVLTIKELAYALKLLNLKEYPIDGDAPVDAVQSRLNFLMRQILEIRN